LAVVSAKKNAIKSTWTPGGLRKITWTPPESTWNMWGKVKSSVDGLTHAAKDAQAAEVVVLDMVSTKATQKMDGRVKCSGFVLFNRLPIAG